MLVSEMYGRCTQSDNDGCRKLGENGLIPPTMSGRLRSYQRFAFRYGRVEVRAKMPVGDWMWPGTYLHVGTYTFALENYHRYFLQK